MTARIVFSICGFVLGYLLATVRHKYMWKRKPQGMKPSDREAVIIEDDDLGNPRPSRVLVRNSPIPRSLAIMLILLAGVGLLSSAYEDHRRSDSDRHDRIQNCLTLAQIKQRGDEGTAANAQLSKSLGELLSAKSNAQARASLESLERFYAARSKQARTLPQLSSAVIADCEDGKFDGTG